MRFTLSVAALFILALTGTAPAQDPDDRSGGWRRRGSESATGQRPYSQTGTKPTATVPNPPIRTASQEETATDRAAAPFPASSRLVPVPANSSEQSTDWSRDNGGEPPVGPDGSCPHCNGSNGSRWRFFGRSQQQPPDGPMLIDPHQYVELDSARRRRSGLAFWRRDNEPQAYCEQCEEVQRQSTSGRRGLLSRLRSRDARAEFPAESFHDQAVEMPHGRNERRGVLSRLFRSRPGDESHGEPAMHEFMDGEPAREEHSSGGMLGRLFRSRSGDESHGEPAIHEFTAEQAPEGHSRSSMLGRLFRSRDNSRESNESVPVGNTGEPVDREERQERDRPGFFSRAFGLAGSGDNPKRDGANQDELGERPEEDDPDADPPGTGPESTRSWRSKLTGMIKPKVRPETTVAPAKLGTDIEVPPYVPPPPVYARASQAYPVETWRPAPQPIAIVSTESLAAPSQPRSAVHEVEGAHTEPQWVRRPTRRPVADSSERPIRTAAAVQSLPQDRRTNSAAKPRTDRTPATSAESTRTLRQPAVAPETRRIDRMPNTEYAARSRPNRPATTWPQPPANCPPVPTCCIPVFDPIVCCSVPW